jgi:taurine transport system substrate-binding protein
MTTTMTRLLGPRLVFAVLLLLLPEAALVTTAQVVIRVRYGYFTETRPILAACARGWLDLDLGHTQYQVTCYPQTSGNFAASRLDNAQLDIANLGSTPMAQAAARGIDVSSIYVSHYTGDSQGIYVRASLDTTPITAPPSSSTPNSTSTISNPFELRGKTIGVPFGSTMHYQVMFLLDLFGLTGDVNLVNMAPSQIIQAWDDGSIDAGACWGPAREYLLNVNGDGNPNLPPANTLMTAGVLADWGRPTFVVVAARNTFARENPDYMTHFLAVVSRINDSFIDRLGEVKAQNTVRWDAQRPVGESLVPSMVDVLLKSSETPHSPSQAYVNSQRRALDLFVQQTAQEQSSCDYLGQVYSSLQQTTEFLLDQKEVASLGQLSKAANKCGGTLLDATWLDRSQAACSNCYPVGPYAGSLANQTNLLEELERLDAESTKSPFASLELGRVAGDSTCQNHQVMEASDVGVTFGDGANARNGKSYSGT